MDQYKKKIRLMIKLLAKSFDDVEDISSEELKESFVDAVNDLQNEQIKEAVLSHFDQYFEKLERKVLMRKQISEEEAINQENLNKEKDKRRKKIKKGYPVRQVAEKLKNGEDAKNDMNLMKAMKKNKTALFRVCCGRNDLMTLKQVMDLFISMHRKDIESTLEDLNVKRAEVFAETVQHFIKCSHMKYTSLHNKDDKTKPTYMDIMSSLCSIYVDLMVLKSRQLDKKKKPGRSLCGFVCAVLEREYRLDVLIQITVLESHDQKFIWPLVKQSLEITDEGSALCNNEVYLKYMMAVLKFGKYLEVLSDIRQSAMRIPAPSDFMEWISQECPDIMDHIPSDKKFKGIIITRFLLEDVDEELYGKLLDVLTFDTTDKERKESSEKVERNETQLENNDAVGQSSEMKSHMDVFFIDTGPSELDITSATVKVKDKSMGEMDDLFFIDKGYSQIEPVDGTNIDSGNESESSGESRITESEIHDPEIIVEDAIEEVNILLKTLDGQVSDNESRDLTKKARVRENNKDDNENEDDKDDDDNEKDIDDDIEESVNENSPKKRKEISKKFREGNSQQEGKVIETEHESELGLHADSEKLPSEAATPNKNDMSSGHLPHSRRSIRIRKLSESQQMNTPSQVYDKTKIASAKTSRSLRSKDKIKTPKKKSKDTELPSQQLLDDKNKEKGSQQENEEVRKLTKEENDIETVSLNENTFVSDSNMSDSSEEDVMNRMPALEQNSSEFMSPVVQQISKKSSSRKLLENVKTSDSSEDSKLTDYYNSTPKRTRSHGSSTVMTTTISRLTDYYETTPKRTTRSQKDNNLAKTVGIAKKKDGVLSTRNRRKTLPDLTSLKTPRNATSPEKRGKLDIYKFTDESDFGECTQLKPESGKAKRSKPVRTENVSSPIKALENKPSEAKEYNSQSFVESMMRENNPVLSEDTKNIKIYKDNETGKTPSVIPIKLVESRDNNKKMRKRRNSEQHSGSIDEKNRGSKNRRKTLTDLPKLHEIEQSTETDVSPKKARKSVCLTPKRNRGDNVEKSSSKSKSQFRRSSRLLEK